jgi:hypothetical protein
MVDSLSRWFIFISLLLQLAATRLPSGSGKTWWLYPQCHSSLGEVRQALQGISRTLHPANVPIRDNFLLIDDQFTNLFRARRIFVAMFVETTQTDRFAPRRCYQRQNRSIRKPA